MTRRHTGRAAAAALAALLLCACGGGAGDLRVGGNDQPAPEVESATVAPEEVTPEPTEEPTQAETGELTPPGTTLRLGETATLPAVDNQGGKGVVEIAVTRIEYGDRDDLGPDAASYGPQAVPVYAFYEVTLLEGAGDLAGWSPAREMLGRQPDGSPSGLLITGGAVGPCAPAEVPDGAADGATLSGCFTALSLGGVPVTGVTYSADDDAYAPGSGSVVWTS